MFAWARRLWNNGEVPPEPPVSDLDWPDEEEWYFDSDAWKWRKRDKKQDPYNPFEDEYGLDLLNAIGDDDDASSVDDNTVQFCCGGQCRMPTEMSVPEIVHVTPSYEPSHFDYSPPAHADHGSHGDCGGSSDCGSSDCGGGGDGGGGGD